MKNKSDRLALVMFCISALFAAFSYGVIAHKYELFPYTVVRNALNVFTSKPAHFLHPIRYDYVGAASHDPASIAPGVTLITSYWSDRDWRPGVRVLDVNGDVLHRWNINPAQIWPQSPYSDGIAGELNKDDNYVHGSYLFPNGDVLVNIEYLGLVRLDACGEPVWKLPYRTHHSVSRDENGDFWVSGVRWVDTEEGARNFPGLRPPFAEDLVLKVSPNGEVLKEISILRAMFDGGYQHLLFKHQELTGDVTHINDVEALGTESAGEFPLFSSGDLVVSLKHVSAVMVLDQSGTIKWIDSQHTNRQHDADFEADGWITVFDNREDGTVTGEFLGGSAISAFNPYLNSRKKIYPVDESKSFFTNAGGKQQLLANGNRLITEVRAGRVFEIDSGGRTVWEWVQEPIDAKLVAEVMEGSRYDISLEVVAGWECQ